MRRTRLWLALVALVAVGAGVAGWRLALRDSVDPASVDDALSRYRTISSGSVTPATGGVYQYRTTGFERVSALGGSRHDYPGKSTITVTAAAGCMELRWDVLADRYSSYQVCTADGGSLRLGDWEEMHTFFGQPTRSVWTCSPSSWLDGTEAIGTSTSYRCDSGDTLRDGTVDIVGEDTVAVGSEDVDVLHVRLRASVTGEARGELVEDRWVERKTGLPVRVTHRVKTENDSSIGNVDFEERYELNLLSLEPLR